MTKSVKKKRKTGRRKKTGSFGKWWLAKLFSLLKFFFRPQALKLYVVMLVGLASYIVYLDATIRGTFEGKKWQLPARVYARPLELFEGLPLAADELEAELRDLGYQSLSATQPGSYHRSANTITLYSRGYQFWDAAEPLRQAQIVFRRGRIKSLRDLAGQDLPLLRLEPMEIGAIYPRHREDRLLVKVEEVPPLLTAALLAVEDHRFYEHSGISASAVARAAWQNFKSGAVVQGGSTVTQQLVKNFYLSQKRTLARKFTEAIMALLLELHYDKEKILEAYLNEVYLGQAGSRAIHGFGLASQHYFNRPLHELSIEKLALLVAIVRGPTYYDPWRNAKRAMARRNLVLDVLVSHDLLAENDAAWARQQPLNLGKQSRSHFVFPAYMDIVKRQLSEVYKEEDMVSNGLRVYTSFDPRVQRKAEAAIQKRLSAMGDEKLQAAMVVTHPTTGEILAIVGGRAPRYAGFNRALDASRSIGSLIKPFIYLAALNESGQFTLATMLDDSPVEFEDRDGEIWSPRNFDRQSHGDVPFITALARSYNQATARLGQQLGVEKVASTLSDLGLTRTVNAVPSLFIGTTQLSPIEVAGLYQTLAANGYLTPLKAIRSVLDNNGAPLERFPFETRQVGGTQTNYLIQHAMVHAGQYGSARSAFDRLGADKVFAGKTGTSGRQRDSWFAGYTGDLLAVVWMGYDDNAPTTLTGSSGALSAWSELMVTASKQPLKLMQPSGIEEQWVDLHTGQRSRSRCANAIQLPFIEGSSPTGSVSCTRR